MRTILPPQIFSALLGLALIGYRATADSSPPKLPADITINKDAGRGSLLIVPVKLESGEELPFVVDTGSSMTLFDTSLESKLGKRVGTMSLESWGKTKKQPLYAAPRLYLGGAPLMTGTNVSVMDFKGLSSGAGHPILGMLSSDCLKNYCIQLDFQTGRMRFLETNQVDAAKLGKAFPIVFRGRRPFINHVALVPGTSTNALIDSGFDMDGRVQPEVIQEPGTGRVRLPECVWDGDIYTNLTVGRGENANLLGLRFLARHLVTIDFPNRTLYLLRRSAGPLPAAPADSKPTE